MRIKSSKDLEGLGSHARKQIEGAMNSKKQQNTDISSPRKRPPRKRLFDDDVRFCEWPSRNPAVWLHIALEKEFKSYWSGGDFVCEIMLPDSPKNWRYDFCLLSSRILIEFDGYGFHRSKEAFQNDSFKSGSHKPMAG